MNIIRAVYLSVKCKLKRMFKKKGKYEGKNCCNRPFFRD